MLEQLDRGEAHRRPEQVDQAGDEQGDARAIRRQGWYPEVWPWGTPYPTAGRARNLVTDRAAQSVEVATGCAYKANFAADVLRFVR